MKRILSSTLIVLFLISFPGPAHAQIPNPGFETWSGVVGNETPAGWITDNIPGFAVPITKTATAHSGSLALQGAESIPTITADDLRKLRSFCGIWRN